LTACGARTVGTGGTTRAGRPGHHGSPTDCPPRQGRSAQPPVARPSRPCSRSWGGIVRLWHPFRVPPCCWSVHSGGLRCAPTSSCSLASLRDAPLAGACAPRLSRRSPGLRAEEKSAQVSAQAISSEAFSPPTRPELSGEQLSASSSVPSPADAPQGDRSGSSRITRFSQAGGPRPTLS
jgi:hypothetical protein